MRGHFAYLRGNHVDKLCYYVFLVLFTKDLKSFEAIWFGPSAVSDFKSGDGEGLFASAGGLFIRNSKDLRIN